MRTVLLALLIVSQAFSLTLEQVKSELGETSIPRDSAEMNLRISVKAAGISQQTDVIS